MPVKIHRQEDENSIPVREMKDGQIGEIIKWGCNSDKAVGQIVQRLGDNVVQVGCDCGKQYPDTAKSARNDLRVRILPPGTLLEIV